MAALGPLFDQVTFAAPLSPHEVAAHHWLTRGLELVGSDLVGASDAFGRAVALGSDVAMSWLGVAMFDAALKVEMDPSDADAIALAGLGWLETASLAGVACADDWLRQAIGICPQPFVDAWNLRPLYANVTVH